MVGHFYNGCVALNLLIFSIGTISVLTLAAENSSKIEDSVEDKELLLLISLTDCN